MDGFSKAYTQEISIYMKNILFKVLDFISTEGAILAFLKCKIFSLASYKILTRVRHSGINPSTIIDIGANIGQFSCMSNYVFPQANIYAIEPDPKVFSILSSNTNFINRISLFNFAIGDYSRMINFNINADTQISSVLELGEKRKKEFPKNKVISIIETEMKTLDSILSSNCLTKPILIKIDVQGFEDKVLVGARKLLKDIDWVILEVSFGDLYVGEANFDILLDSMKSSGFYFIGPMNFHFSPDGSKIIEMDALFKRKS